MTRSMVRFFTSLLAAAALVLPLALATPANAQDRTPGLNHRQRNQQSRIRQGVKSGELTRGEARHLESREGRLQANKLEDKAKGPLTHRDRARLQRQANRNSRAIYRDKHNKRVR
ncbi:MAG TPA: hypothetical protein VFZ08_01550 [Terriglobia bacterium]|nr:hypothetical protein [Terriglobia bacterium]